MLADRLRMRSFGGEIIYVAGNNIVYSIDTEINMIYPNKNIYRYIDVLEGEGSIRLTWQFMMGSGTPANTSITGSIYRNSTNVYTSSNVGPSYSNNLENHWYTFTYDVPVVAGDTIQLYLRHYGTGSNVYTRSYAVKIAGTVPDGVFNFR